MKVLKRVLKIAGYTILVCIGLIIILVGFTQTSFFKERLRTIVVSTLSTQLNGSLTLGTIRGNFFTGFSVDSVAIYQGSEVVFSARSIAIEYEPLPFLRKEMHILHLIIEQPDARFARPAKGEWNFIKLIKAADTSGGGTFDWTITLDDLQLRGGTVSLVDSASLVLPGHAPVTDSTIEYHHFRIDNLTFSLAGRIAHDLIKAEIRHLSLSVRTPEFQLTEFTGEIEVAPTGVTANKIVLRTSGSEVELNAAVLGLNLFRGVELSAMGYDSTRLRLRSTSIDFHELGMFIPEVAFLNGSASLECDAEGKFGNLSIPRLQVQTRQSTVHMRGNLRNLQQPENLYLNLSIGDTRINGPDVAELMPAFQLPRFERLGTITLSSEFEGAPLNFKTKTSLGGSFGEVRVEGTLNMERELPAYTCAFTTKGLDIGKVLEQDELRTSLSALGTLEGKGFTLDTISANLFLNIDSSKVQDLVFKVGQLNVHALPHRLEFSSSFSALDMSATVAGHTQFLDSDHPKFYADIDLSSFDLSKLLHDTSYASDLTLHTTLDGSGRSIDDLNGTMKLLLQPSRYQGRTLSPLEIDLSLDQHDASNKRLSIQSSLADVEFDGKFDLDVAIASIANLSANLVQTIEEHASPPDTAGQRKAAPTVRLAPHTLTQRMMDFTYMFKIYDLEPLSAFVGGKQFNAHGAVKGAISGTDERLTFSADATIDEFFTGTVNNGIFLNNSHIEITANNLSPYRTLETLSARMNASVGAGLFNSRTLSSARGTIAYNQLKGTFTFVGIVDSFYHVSVGGQSSIQPNTYVFDLDSLRISSAGGEGWMNDQDIQTRLNYEGFRVMHALVKHGDESLSFTGAMKHNGEIDFTGTLRSYDLAGLNFWLRNPELGQPGQGFGGTLDADVQLSGTTDAPTIALTSIFQNVSVKQTYIGTAMARINYVNRFANVDITVRESPSDSTPTLTIAGRVPVDLAFKEVAHRFPDEQQQLSVVSEGFDLSVLDPVIRDLDNLRGKLRCNVAIAGTPQDPRYSGAITLSDVQCVFGPNNIPYVVNGELTPEGNTLVLKNLTVTNPPSEQWKSDARFTGSLTLKDFGIESFNITAYGQLLLMTKASRKTMPTFYGLLFTEIDPQGLTLQGTLEQPYLSGNLSILNADLEYPPTLASDRSRGQLLNYVLVDDTTKRTQDTVTFSSKFYHLQDTAASSPEERTFRRAKPSFVDRLRYNLGIDTKGTTAIKMIFTPTTNEELYAELEGKVTAVNDRGAATIYGEITVLPRSYYNFFKRFDASGSLRFVGPWDNPVLDIDAAYESYAQAQYTSGQTSASDEQKSAEQKVIVKLKITGTRYEPKLAMTMQIQKDPSSSPVDYASGDVQSDAISFILTGKFRDKLSSAERENIATSFGSAGVSGITSGLMSSIFTDFLRQEFPFIRSAEVSYGGGSLQESANLRLSGEAFNGYFRFGGKILNDLNNANVSYQLSLGRMLNVQSIRNLFIELERKVEGSDLTEDKKLTNNARLYYRISF